MSGAFCVVHPEGKVEPLDLAPGSITFESLLSFSYLVRPADTHIVCPNCHRFHSQKDFAEEMCHII